MQGLIDFRYSCVAILVYYCLRTRTVGAAKAIPVLHVPPPMPAASLQLFTARANAATHRIQPAMGQARGKQVGILVFEMM